MPPETAAARDVSGYANRRGPIDAKIKAARALNTPDGRRDAQDLAKSAIPPPPFNALLLADTGDELAEIAAILPYYDVDRGTAQIIAIATRKISEDSSETTMYGAPARSRSRVPPEVSST